MKVESQTILKPRVAVAEDDPNFRAVLVAALHHAGFAVTEAHDGRELIDLLQSTSPGFFSVVVTDQQMPRHSGLECLALAGARAPFVIVSGKSDPAFLAAAARLNAAAVVRKPVDVELLVQLVTNIIRRGLEEGRTPQRRRALR
jgi:two-component system phosphate regulon response regulator OmpR